MRRSLRTTSLLFGMFAGAVAYAAAPAVSVHDQESAVLRLVLHRYAAHRGGEISQTLLLPVSINPSDLSADLSAVARSGAPRELVEKARLSFGGEQMHFGDVRTPFRVATLHELAQVRSLSPTGVEKWKWDRFAKQFPNQGGILEFGVPAFDATRNIAVIYMRHLCGEQCGETYLYCLVRTNEGWVIATDLPLSAQ